MDALSEVNDTFALYLLKILCEDNASHNVFFSPLSIPSALALVFLGVKGNTAARMSQMGKELTFEKFIAWTNLHHMMCTEVEVFLPRFTLEDYYNMESVLQCLEIVDAFQVGKANFLAMSSEEDLCLPKFVHKVFVEVYEDSTEATAASHMEAFDCCLENVPRFCTDHPFLFFIRHNKANCILFCGKFLSP